MFVKSILVGALAALAFAQQQGASSVLTFTRTPNPATAGQPFAITYATNDTTSPVTITLRKGNPNDLQTVSTLTNDATNGQYIWTPSSSLENDNDYALQIEQGDQVNYFGPFTIQGASGSSSASSSASASATSSGAVAAGNGTASRTMTAMMPYGTGNATMPRNTTMSSASLTATRSESSERPEATNTGAGFQGTQSAASPSSTGNSAPIVAGSSAMALVLGAVAAIVMG